MSRRKGAEVPTKAKNPLKTLKNLLKFLSNESVAMIFILVLAAVGNGLNLLGPRFSGAAIDAMGQRDLSAVYASAFKMLAAYVIWAFLTYLTSVLMIRLSQRIVVRMRQRTFDKLVELPLSYLDSHQTGDLVSRISYDIDTINTSLSNDIIQILSSAITVVGSLVMMILISWELTLIFVVTVPISVLFTRYRVRLTRPLFSRRSRKLGDMNGFVEEVLTGHRTIQSYDREDEFTQWFDDQNDTATKAYYEAEYQSSINFPTISLITNLSLAMISMLGGLLFLQGRLTVGALSAFVLYSRKFSGPINEIANIIAELQSALSAAERVFELLDEPSEQNIDQPLPLPLATGKVEFNHVQFSYVENVPVIHDFSLKVQPGQLVAIVGPTGAGKTTLINLLMRFYQPQQGQILIDDVDINQADFVKVRQSFAMVLQDTWLFEGTIRENIAYGKPEATMEEIRAAAKAAHIDRYIRQQPQGYDTIISDGATNLSQGQKQLLTLARAMLIDAPMLILDEATSNVDSRTELLIQDAMNKLMEGRTSFVIAHRLSTIQNADHILVLQDGNIVEQGTHEALLSNRGAYSNLYQAQFE